MAIGTPTSLGTKGSAASTSSPITFTTTADITAGNLALVTIEWGTTSGITITGVSDGTNTYTLAIAAASGTYGHAAIYYKENASFVPSGATITVSFTGTADDGYGIQGSQVSGIITSSSLDRTATYTSAFTQTPSATTASLSQADELVIGVAYIEYSNYTSFTESSSSSFTTLFNALAAGYNASKASVSYKITAATTAITYAPTWVGTPNDGSPLAVATFKGAATATQTFIGSQWDVGSFKTDIVSYH